MGGYEYDNLHRRGTVVIFLRFTLNAIDTDTVVVGVASVLGAVIEIVSVLLSKDDRLLRALVPTRVSDELMVLSIERYQRRGGIAVEDPKPRL